MRQLQILVLAKEPVPGRVKTRLTPPLSPQQAAAVASAALEDTLDAVRRVGVAARVLVSDGVLTAHGYRLQAQVDGPLDVRLAAAFDDAWHALPLPMLLIGMDTPQLTERLLDQAAGALLAPGTQAVIGLAEDGGWWALGLREPHAELVRGIPTSRIDTGVRQLRRLQSAGLRVVQLPEQVDVDTAADLRRVARLAPHGRFAAAVREVLA